MDSFALIEYDGPTEAGVSFLINGYDIADLLAEHGSHDGLLPLDDIERACDQTVFTTESSSHAEDLMILVCSCGIAACGSTTVTVTRSPETVTWSKVYGWGRGAWVVFPVGPFTFDAAIYDRALARGREIAEAFHRLNSDPQPSRDA